MPGHLAVESDDAPARAANSPAQLRLFSRDQARVVPPDLAKGLGPKHRVAPASVGITGRRVPLHVRESIPEARIRIAFASPSTHDGHVGVLREVPDGSVEPPGNQLAVSVHELHPGEVGMLLGQHLEARVPTACRGVRARGVEFHGLGPQLERPRHAPIARAAVDVHDRCVCVRKGLQAPDEPLSLVAADHDDAESHGGAPLASPAWIQPRTGARRYSLVPTGTRCMMPQRSTITTRGSMKIVAASLKWTGPQFRPLRRARSQPRRWRRLKRSS
jgi:hypothetical protein